MGKYQNALNINSFGNFVASVQSSGFHEIDLRPFDFIDAYATMGLALLVRHACLAVQTPDLIVPSSDNVRMYLARQEFFQVISRWYEIPQELRALESCQWAGNPRVAPLRIIEKDEDVSPVADRIERLLTSPAFGIPKPFAKGVWNILTEVFQNVPQHASIGLDRVEPGIAVLQVYRGCVEMAVGDIGVGLRSTLSQNPMCVGRCDGELQELVLKQGVSRTALSGRGHGLYQVAATIAKLNGLLRLQSGRAATTMGSRVYRQDACTEFPGTQLWIRLPCRT
jgi:hypothetical protein